MRRVPKNWNHWCRKNKLLPGHNTKQGKKYRLEQSREEYENCLSDAANTDYFYCSGWDRCGVRTIEEVKSFCCQIPYIDGWKRYESKKKKHWEWNVLDRDCRRYRVTDRGTFQICDGNFDRWANSVGAEVPIPRNEKEFDQALKSLREMSQIKGDKI